MLRLQQAQNRPLTRKIKNVCPSWPSWPSYPKTPTKPPIFQPVQDGRPQKLGHLGHLARPRTPALRSSASPAVKNAIAVEAWMPKSRCDRSHQSGSPNSLLLTPYPKKRVDLVDLENLTPKPQRRASASAANSAAYRDGKSLSFNPCNPCNLWIPSSSNL